MKAFLPQNLINLANICPKPLYLVGGSVRDFLLGYPIDGGTDWDICSPCTEEELVFAAEKCGFSVCAFYKNTGTVKLKDGDGVGYEFTRFRSDEYVRGVHTPTKIFFTDNVEIDARRRDFCANAIYYEIKSGQFVDPLGGILDVQRKILRTVAPANKVFGEDGLRLMRLARFSAQLSFTPDEDCMRGAQTHAVLIKDIAPERIFAEMSQILLSDLKHGDKDAPYRGLCILKDTGVLSHIFPELALGEGLFQRSDFHNYDVLEHSLRAVRYSTPDVRFAALLHDVGKPFCYRRDGNFYLHGEEGERIAGEILTRLKAPKKLIEQTKTLVRLHMRDYNLQMKESKVRLELQENFPLLPRLFALKQADFSGCKDNLSPAPTTVKWRAILQKMQEERVPFSLKELALNGKDLLDFGVKEKDVSHLLRELMRYCALDGTRNERGKLFAHLRVICK